MIESVDPTGGWKIAQIGPVRDRVFQLYHPHYHAITGIPTFDEALELRKVLLRGGEAFIKFVRDRERFLANFKKYMER